ncbi:hypothetical protein Tco_0647002 [Tanacetum coccineum]
MGYAEEIEEMLEIKVYEIGGHQEIFTSKVWRRLFDIKEKNYIELCHEFYCTFAFDEKMITYGVCPRTTWYDKMQRNELWLMSKFEAKHQNVYVMWPGFGWKNGSRGKTSESKEIV